MATENAGGRSDPLQPLERLICRAHDELDCIGNAAVRGRIDGPVTPAALRHAVCLLGRRYPQLRAAVRKQQGRLSFVCEPSAADLACEIISDDVASGWKQRMEVEIRIPFDAAQGPLVRVFGLFSATHPGCDMLLIAHHVVIDGKSLFVILRDIIRWLENPPATVDPVDWQRPHKIVFRGAGFWPSLRATRQYIRWLRATRRIPKARIDWSSAVPQQCDFILWNRHDTQRLAERARRESTTVSGAIIAATTKLMAEAKGETGHRQSIQVPHSLRAWYEPVVDDNQVGLYVSLMRVMVDTPGETPFWELARRARQAITDDFSRNGPVFLHRTLTRLGPWLWWLSRISTAKERVAHACINNLGRWPVLASASGTIRLQELMWIANNQSSPPGIDVNVVTIDGVLNVSLQSARHTARELADFTRGLLELLRVETDAEPRQD